MEKLLGADVVSAMTEKMREQLTKMQAAPCLATVRVGEKGDDISYERGAKKRMEKLGIECKSYVFDADISNDDFMREFSRINEDESVNGILLLRPLPKHLDEKKICEIINPEKDVDCISPVNIEKVFVGDETGFLPCTAAAVMECLSFANVDLQGKNAVVVGRSLVVGKPLSMLLLNKNATVTICHSKTQDLAQVCSRADVLISCIGRAKMLTDAHVKSGAVVIDVGINVDDDGKLCGDFDFEKASEKAQIITPVPGGVWSVTTAVLGLQVIRAAKMQWK